MLRYASMYVLCCAAAASDGGVDESRLNFCTNPLLTLTLTRCGSGVVCTSMQMAEQHRPRCPICGVWKGNLSKRSNSKKCWYPIASCRLPLVDQLDEALAAVPCNDHICPVCYNRIRRRSQRYNTLDELTAAAEAQQDAEPMTRTTSPSLSSTVSTSLFVTPPRPRPGPTPVPLLPFTPPSHQRLTEDSPASCLSTLPASSPIHILQTVLATKRTFTQLINDQLPLPVKRIRSARVREHTHAEKRRLLKLYEEGSEWQRWGLEWLYNLDRQKRKRWRRTLRNIAAMPAKQRPPMDARRINAQVWLADNSKEVEQKIFDTVIAMRHRRLPVSLKQLRALATKFSVNPTFKASAKFALSFMSRWRISRRVRTTTKDISSAKVLKLALTWQIQFWRNKFPCMGGSVDSSCLWNMDETSVYLDMPPSKTLDLIGVKSVEIATTQHDYTRVAVVLCCNRTGEMLEPLVIHKCNKNTRNQNHVTKMTVQSSNKSNGGYVNMFVTKNSSGWLNGPLMQTWIRDIFTPAMNRSGRRVQQQCLFMDNCSAHTTADVWNAMLDGGFQFEFFPPNCTPVLQPCDMNINREFKREWSSCWLDWFIEFGSTPENWTPKCNPRKASDSAVHQWIARCMDAITAKTVRDSWNRSVFAVWWWFLLERKLFERIMLFAMEPNSREWEVSWLMYVWYVRRLPTASNVPVAKVSGRTKKKAESKEEHDKGLAGYEEMERRRRALYEAPLIYESDEDDELEAAKQQEEAEQLVELLDECQDCEDDEDKENQQPEVVSEAS
jgi:hypothetical protein